MGLDYLHRICGIIHTDLKPENVVFEIESRAKLDLLESMVLNTPLVELFDHTEPILLSKKQLAAHKKNQRKRKNKQAAKAATVDDIQADEEETKGDQTAAYFLVKSEIIDNKYIVLKKLGWGHFSTVWLALKLQDKKLYALKIQKSANKYSESAEEEEEILFAVARPFPL